jgi:hypothetical protein
MLTVLSKIFTGVKSLISCLNITYITHGCIKLLNFIIDLKKESDLKKKTEKIEKINSEIEDVCNNGTLSDLFDVTKKAGKEND